MCEFLKRLGMMICGAPGERTGKALQVIDVRLVVVPSRHVVAVHHLALLSRAAALLLCWQRRRHRHRLRQVKLNLGPNALRRAGWVSRLLLKRLPNAVRPPGPRTHKCRVPAKQLRHRHQEAPRGRQRAVGLEFEAAGRGEADHGVLHSGLLLPAVAVLCPPATQR